jgi:mercuric reductase
MIDSYDLVILGSGTTAFAAAQEARLRGARVLMIEQSRIGGTCINWGCVPSKTLIHKAELYHAARRSADYGLNLSAEAVACPDLMTAKQKAIDRVRRDHYQTILDDHPEIDILKGHGRLLGPGELHVGPEVVHCERILIATGGVPRSLALPGLRETGYLNSYSALSLKSFPESVIILGGGVIALEMGQMFQRFGCQVTILERGEQPLKEFDRRLTERLTALMAAEGLRQHFGVESRRVESTEQGVCVVADVHGREARFEAERIMLAVGTAPATEGIGLDVVGVDCDAQGFIEVDNGMRTTAEGIWAAGDVTGPPMLAPAGEMEARVAVNNMFGWDPVELDHNATPMAVFIDPEIALVGQNAEQALAESRTVAEVFLDLSEVAKSHIVDQTSGGFLLWADAQTGQTLGAQVLAPRAADLIHEPALAVRNKLHVRELANLVHVYPSISDGWRLAALRCMEKVR